MDEFEDTPPRYRRIHEKERRKKKRIDNRYYRTASERDRDRVLYCSSFRRLAGVTQVIDPAEGQVFHNRLTHTLKVAQLSRRLAQRLLKEHLSECEELGGVDPDVVEAAALAHDIGHPPFGHVAEKTLDDLIKPKMYDGFEGNAQSFRVVNKLAQRSADYSGLDLCRATLNAIPKYPWKREQTLTKKRKRGYYITESKEFAWTRENFLGAEDEMSLEARIMDWCDDIAYSVSDLEDFYRAGVIPLDRLVTDHRERERFYKGVFDRWKRNDGETTPDEQDQLKAAFEKVVSLFPIEQPYIPTRRRRAALRAATSGVINVYIRAPRLVRQRGDLVWEIDQKHLDRVKMLKEVTWEYVITNPALARQQYGKAKVIKNLFEVFKDASDDPKLIFILPANCQQELDELSRNPIEDVDPDDVRLRLVADVIANMTDFEALRIHERVTGIAPGSMFDRLPL